MKGTKLFCTIFLFFAVLFSAQKKKYIHTSQNLQKSTLNAFMKKISSPNFDITSVITDDVADDFITRYRNEFEVKDDEYKINSKAFVITKSTYDMILEKVGNDDINFVFVEKDKRLQILLEIKDKHYYVSRRLLLKDAKDDYKKMSDDFKINIYEKMNKKLRILRQARIDNKTIENTKRIKIPNKDFLEFKNNKFYDFMTLNLGITDKAEYNHQVTLVMSFLSYDILKNIIKALTSTVYYDNFCLDPPKQNCP